MQRRQAKANTPTTETTKNKHEYLLSGIGRCWICYEHGMHKVGLRGSQGGNHNQYYRCAVMLDKRKGKSSKELLGEVLDNGGVQSIENENWRELVDAHTTNLRAKKVEAQVDQLISNFTIPETWYEMIAAYYLSDDGMAEFERESYNLRQELNRAKELYSNGFISLADFQEKALTIGKSLESYQPSAQPEARDIVAMLKNFPKVWATFNTTERKKLLKVMFLSIYFDPTSKIKLVLAHEPFDRMLPINLETWSN